MSAIFTQHTENHNMLVAVFGLHGMFLRRKPTGYSPRGTPFAFDGAKHTLGVRY